MDIDPKAQREGRQRGFGHSRDDAEQPSAALAADEQSMVQRWCDQQRERAAHQDQRHPVEHPIYGRKLAEAFLERAAKLEA
jgi:hypothetical protein